MSSELPPPIIQEQTDPSLLERFHDSAINFRTKLGRLASAGLILTGGTFAAFAAEEAVHPTAAYADTLGYPWPTDSEAPCQFGAAGGASCTNPNNPNDKYDWGVYISGVFHPYREGGGYEYRNCTDYVAWKLESLGVAASQVNGLGNGGQWYNNVPASERSTTPKAWDAAVSPGTVGHVAFVESVNTDGTITVSEYNHDVQGHGDTRTGTASAMGFTEFVDFGVHPSGSGGGSIKAGKVFGKGDFNNDGISDYIVNSGGYWAVKSGSGAAGNPMIEQGVQLGSATDKMLVGDFNGDGIADFVVNSGGQWAVKSGSNAVNNPMLQQGVSLGGPNDTPLLGDFNGDGVPDFTIYSGGNWYVRSGATGNPYVAQGMQFGGPNDTPLVGDFNGDGISDYVIYSGGQWAVKSGAAGNGMMEQGIVFGNSGCTPFVRDVNHDGKSDFVVDCGGTWYAESGVPGNNTALFLGVQLGSSTDVPLMGDFNGDGYYDIGVDSGGQWAVKSGAPGNGYVTQGMPLGLSSDTPMGG